MGLIDDIRKIDPKFAAAIEAAKSAQEVLKASPWAWFTPELKRIFPGLSPQREEIRGISFERSLTPDIGYRHIELLTAKLFSGKKLSATFVKRASMLFHNPEQSLIRLLMEINGLPAKDRPVWFDVIKFLCG